ncbi:MAG TPA: hypothetical protein VFC46_14950 [Humisphaera sp.]|nr:hypothetical protein [Humisphaera sp.]
MRERLAIFPFLLLALRLASGCASSNENQVSTRIASLDAYERFAPVYHKTFALLRPMEIWTIDMEEDRTPRLGLPLVGDRCPPKPTGIVLAGTRVSTQDLALTRTTWQGHTLGENRTVIAKIEDGKFAGLTVELLGWAIVIDPRIQCCGIPAHLTWVPNVQNVVEALSVPTTSKSQP